MKKFSKDMKNHIEKLFSDESNLEIDYFGEGIFICQYNFIYNAERNVWLK